MSNSRQQETLTSHDLELVIQPDIGGRLWDIVFQGRSLLFQNTDLSGYVPDPEKPDNFPTRSPQFPFPLWGGEKTWIAPDTNWPDGAPYPVLDSGPYTVREKTLRHVALASAICPISGLQIHRVIRLTDPASWSIEHKVINQSVFARDVGIWSVMMLDHSARIGVPGENLIATSVFGIPNGCVATSKQGLVCDCNALQEFKVGINTRSPYSFLRLDTAEQQVWISCTIPAPKQSGNYAHATAFEVFNSGDYPYCEAEWHAPLRTLRPKAETRFHQDFSIWSGTPPPTLDKTNLEFIRCMS